MKFQPLLVVGIMGLCYIGRLRPEALRTVSRGRVQWLECPALARIRWLVHGFSTRHGGVTRGPARGLNLGFVECDSRANVEKNRREFTRALRVHEFLLASLRQVHSTNIFLVGANDGLLRYTPSGTVGFQELTERLPVGDVLLTDQPRILLSVRTADCLPVLMVDPRRRAIAALHAGWRGALGRIAEKAVGVMRAAYGSDPRRLIAAIGPGIRVCCYAVGEEVVSAFQGRFIDTEAFFPRVPARDRSTAAPVPGPLPLLSPFPPGHAPDRLPTAHLDLGAVVQDQLRNAGLRPNRIHDLKVCTSCRTDLFFSHRKEGPETGRIMAVIGIKPGARVLFLRSRRAEREA